jgi:hypothetical protein
VKERSENLHSYGVNVFCNNPADGFSGDRMLPCAGSYEGRDSSASPDTGTSSDPNLVDTRSISIPELRAKVEEAVNLQTSHKDRLFDTLIKYKDFFTKRPGKCNLMRYRFEV